MESIREQKAKINNDIASAEQHIATLKETIKEHKAKIKKLEKLEKEFNTIFGIELEDVSTDTEEVPGQMVMQNVA